ncbi:MAG: undecaprenyl-diphosphatase UppP, partial [Clostridia bacterium]|nr:undecaprenyl-diphosphatase UppP [Clostridia bacterium]
MEQIIKAIILGVVEGITEFLPVSSTGHLIIAGDLLDFKGSFAVLFEVVIQFGAILAVLFYYRNKIFESLSKLKPGQTGFALWSKILVAFLPSAVLGLIAKDFIEENLFTSYTVSIALIIGGLLILLVGKWGAKPSINRIEELTYKHVFFIGIMQCLALFPGMSRSASTILGGMLAGVTLNIAAEFSFFLAIPTMLGATMFSLFDGVSGLTLQNWVVLCIGFSVSFLTALLVIDK